MFNIRKYSGKKFHQNVAVNKKIEALFLLYDKRVDEMKLDHKGKIKLINIFIDDLIRFEEYEVVQAFRDRKFRKWRKWRSERRNGISLKLRWRLIKFKVNKKARNIIQKIYLISKGK